MTRNRAVAIVAALAAASTWGCGTRKQHIIEHFGSSYRGALDAQVVERPQGPAHPAVGLDSQEAAIVSASYRASLAAEDKAGKAKEQPILIVAPPTRDQPQQLAPSVPKER